VRRAFRYAGFEILLVPSRRFPFPRELFDVNEFEAFFDIGANVCQYAAGFRALGFRGIIVSVEPIEYLFNVLQHKPKRDPNWLVERAGCKERMGEVRANVSGGYGRASLILPTSDRNRCHECSGSRGGEAKDCFPEVIERSRCPSSKTTEVRD
jgi:hypothetical protein